MTNTPQQLWQKISQAGGIESYIGKQLKDKGWLVRRRDTENMSKRQLKEYKESLKKEAAERRKLKKEAWIAYKASHVCYLGDGIYWNDSDSSDTFDADGAEERLAANELPAIDTPAQLAEALSLTIGELRWLSFHREAAESLHYTPFEIPKRTGGSRQIWAPRPKLKTAQRWILDNILSILPVHGAAHGFLPERSILTNARPHTNSKRVIRVDLSDYFPTVTLPRVKGLFRQFGYREQIASLLALICTESPRQVHKIKDKTYYVAVGPRCLPQGAPTSPAISNIVSLNLDRRLEGLCKKQGWRYTRYADDLTFSLPDDRSDCDPQTGYLLGAVRRIVEEEGFKVNEKKTWVARKGGKQSVTGLMVNGEGEPRVPRPLKRWLRAAIHNLKNGRDLMPGESIHQLIGYAAFVTMVEPELGKSMLSELYPFVKE